MSDKLSYDFSDWSYQELEEALTVAVKAFEDIQKHQQVVSEYLYRVTGAWKIADKALSLIRGMG